MKKIGSFLVLLCLFLVGCGNMQQVPSNMNVEVSSNISDEERSYYEFAKKEACSNHRDEFLKYLGDKFGDNDIVNFNYREDYLGLWRYEIYYSPSKNTCIGEAHLIYRDALNNLGYNTIILDLFTLEEMLNSSFYADCDKYVLFGNDYCGGNDKYLEWMNNINNIRESLGIEEDVPENRPRLGSLI